MLTTGPAVAAGQLRLAQRPWSGGQICRFGRRLWLGCLWFVFKLNNRSHLLVLGNTENPANMTNRDRWSLNLTLGADSHARERWGRANPNEALKIVLL